MTRLNRHAYQRLINEDLEWLSRQPRSLEREHIEVIVRQSPEREYTRASSSAEGVRDYNAGYVAGLEAAAKIADQWDDGFSNSSYASLIASEIRSAITPQEK